MGIFILYILQKIVLYICVLRIFIVSLQCLNKTTNNMKKKELTIKVTEEEFELLEAIRNYNRSYPDGYPQLIWFAQELFDNMLRQPYE